MRLKYCTLFAILLVAFTFTNNSAFASEKTIDVNGQERSYIITTPKTDNFKKPYPAIFVLHGGAGTAEKIRRQYLIEEEAHKLGFTTIFPQGLNHSWNDGRPDSARIRRTGEQPVGDIDFFRVLIDKLVKDGTIRKDAIFFTGVSNGGMMSMRVACEMSDIVRAIAPIVANMPFELGGKCDPEQPISVMIINGTDDKLIPRLGGYVMGKKDRGRVWSIADTMDFWLTNAYCVKEPVVVEIEGDDKNKEYLPIRKYHYNNCAPNVSVHLYEIIGGGHNIPGYEADTRPIFFKRITGKRARNIDAAVEVTNFFYKHIDKSN